MAEPARAPGLRACDLHRHTVGDTRASMKHDVSVMGMPMSGGGWKMTNCKPRGVLQALRLRPLTPQAPSSLRRPQPSPLDCVWIFRQMSCAEQGASQGQGSCLMISRYSVPSTELDGHSPNRNSKSKWLELDRGQGLRNLVGVH